MKLTKLLAVFILLALAVGISAFGQNNTGKTAKKGFAVLELFTSEGCSSCPPADELMGRLQNEYKDNNVYVLSYHVDYWDKQGWKDIFSNAEYTQRQYDYSKWLGFDPIYTPQLIVNGRTEHVGSQESIVRSAITKALSRPAESDLSLKAVQVKNSLAITYKMTGNPKNSRLLIAVVQKSAQSRVKRGENGGRILTHFQIVRDLYKVSLGADGKGNSTISLPKDADPKKWEIIGFIQDMTNGSILGVTKTTF